MTERQLTSPADHAHLLEYVTRPGCSDCRVLEALLAQVVPDYPGTEVRAVTAESQRGIDLSIGRGILRFPVVVLDDEVIAVERIAERELRAALEAPSPARR